MVRAAFFCRVASLCLLLSAWIGWAQDAVRMSIAREEAVERRRRQVATIGYYNVLVGRTAWRLSTGLGLQYCDNVYYRPAQEGDFIFRPTVGIDMVAPLTDRNILSLSVDGGYLLYASHSDLDRLFLKPGTEVSFDVYVGDFAINLHDRIQIEENTYQNPAIAGVASSSTLQNALGLTTIGDFNKVRVMGNYDYIIFAAGPFGGPSSQAEGAGNLFYAAVGYSPDPRMLWGVEAGLGEYDYTRSTALKSFTQINLGGFLAGQLNQRLSVRLHGGYTSWSPEYLPVFPIRQSTTDTFYANLSVRHAPARWFDYTLNLGRTVSLTFQEGSFQIFYVDFGINWHFLRKIVARTNFRFEDGSEVLRDTEDFTRLGMAFSIERKLTRKLYARAGYELSNRSSTIRTREYVVNTWSLSFDYSF